MRLVGNDAKYLKNGNRIQNCVNMIWTHFKSGVLDRCISSAFEFNSRESPFYESVISVTLLAFKNQFLSSGILKCFFAHLNDTYQIWISAFYFLWNWKKVRCRYKIIGTVDENQFLAALICEIIWSFFSTCLAFQAPHGYTTYFYRSSCPTLSVAYISGRLVVACYSTETSCSTTICFLKIKRKKCSKKTVKSIILETTNLWIFKSVGKKSNLTASELVFVSEYRDL